MTTPEMPSLPAAPHGFVARDPADVLAVVPVLLGFEPEDCVVMLTFGAEHQFHARLDLPPAVATDAEVAEVAALLVEPAVRHHVSGVLLVVYSDHAERARRSARCLVDAFGAAGIAVLGAIRADGQRHWPATGPGEGTAYDVSAHPVRAQAVLDGHVTRRSRADLAATLATDERGRADVARALEHRSALAADEVSALLLECLATGSALGPDDVAGLVRAVRRPGRARRRLADDDPAGRRPARGAVVRRGAPHPRRVVAGGGGRAGLRGLALRQRSPGLVRRRPVPVGGP